MPVSYLSQQPFRSSAPIPSIDLNLMASVLQQKQSQFDANYTKAQTLLSTVSSLDMVRPEDRQYRDSKLNELTNNLNNIAGMDFSDPNVSSQIDGSISNLFTDNRILNSVSSTKNIRALQASYQNIQSNPKLAKYYSEANYDADMAEVGRYVNSKDPNDSYNGKSSATLFASYMPDLTKAAEKLKADGWAKLTNGVEGYYNKNTGKVLSPEKISENILGILDSNQRGQMFRDANYLWGKKLNLSPQELVGKITNNISSELGGVDNSIKNYQFLRTKTTDPDKLKLIDDQLGQLGQYKNSLSAKKLNTEKQYNDYLASGGTLEGLRAMAYQDDISKTLGRLFSFKEESIDSKVDAYSLEKVKAQYKEKQLALAFGYKSKLQKELYDLKNSGNSGALVPPIDMPDFTKGKDNANNIKDVIAFKNREAKKYEDQVFFNQNNTPVKLYKDNLTAAAEGKPAILPLNADNLVFDNDVNAFAALSNRQSANRDKGGAVWKAQDVLMVEPSTKNKEAIDKFKLILSKKNPELGTPEDIRIKSIGMSRRQFYRDPLTNQLVPDDNFYADIEVKKGNKYVQVDDVNYKFRVPADFANAISLGKLKPQDPQAKIINSNVDVDNHFSTVIQSKSNPNTAFKITTAKEPNGLYDTYVQINGQAIPISKIFSNDGAKQTKLPWESLQTAKAVLSNMQSREQLQSFLKNYTPDANENSSNIRFDNNTIYQNFDQAVSSFGNRLKTVIEGQNKYGDIPLPISRDMKELQRRLSNTNR